MRFAFTSSVLPNPLVPMTMNLSSRPGVRKLSAGERHLFSVSCHGSSVKEAIFDYHSVWPLECPRRLPLRAHLTHAHRTPLSFYVASRRPGAASHRRGQVAAAIG